MFMFVTHVCVQCSREQQSLLWCLSFLDTVEVAVEVLTQRFAGEPSKWGVVILMQIIRLVGRGVVGHQGVVKMSGYSNNSHPNCVL